jgi:hypothetical protein
LTAAALVAPSIPSLLAAPAGPPAREEGRVLEELTGWTPRRQFHPRFYVSIFAELGVGTVVRLNEPTYERCSTQSRR